MRNLLYKRRKAIHAPDKNLCRQMRPADINTGMSCAGILETSLFLIMDNRKFMIEVLKEAIHGMTYGKHCY